MITTDLNGVVLHTYDVCIVGSGIVGLAMAAELAQLKLSVLVLESGLPEPDKRYQSLSDAQIGDLEIHFPMNQAVSRALGGGSMLWGGRCVFLDHIDFELRDHIPNSGWPFPYDELAQHAAQAASWLGCGQQSLDLSAWTDIEDADVDFTSVERWTNRPQILETIPQLRTRKDIIVVTDATVVGLEFEIRTVRGLRVTRGDGSKVTVRCAKCFVLALGGIETTRLLLNSRFEYPQLFGGPDGPLGRYYMGHISGVFAEVQFRDPKFALAFRSVPSEKSFAQRRLVIRDSAQVANRLPNIAFWPDNPHYSNPDHRNGLLSLIWFLLSMPYVRSRLAPQALIATGEFNLARAASHARNLAIDALGMMRGVSEIAWQRYRYGRRIPRTLFATATGTYPLHFHAEQMPRRENRLQLIRDQDWLGMHRVAVEAGPSQIELEGIARAHKVLDGALRRTGLGELQYRRSFDGTARSLGLLPDGLHQIGLARMSNARLEGVVDADCRVREFDNLYLAGSAVFPTSGQANPTFPAVALAMRLAGHLARKSVINASPNGVLREKR